MKKFYLLLFMVISVTNSVAKTFQTTYAVKDDEVFRSGSQIVRRCIIMTFGEDGGPDFNPAISYPLNKDFNDYCPGNNVNGDVKGGTFYVFNPTKDGTITVAVLQNQNKKLFVEEDGTALPDFNGKTVAEQSKYMLTFQVKRGSTYKLYCKGSKLGFYGFIYSWEDQAVEANFETATEAVKNMGLGWNLGNTLDSHTGSYTGKSAELTSPQDWEACWGNGVTPPELMAMMKRAGFNAIRVPVTWFPHIADNGVVDKKWMKRVHEVVDYVISQGMYCILNTHHETEYRKWDDVEKRAHISADEDNYQKNKETFEFLWMQIANEFKDYDQRLIFEGYNEMTDIYCSWGSPNFWEEQSCGYGAYRSVNNYAQSFVNSVRSTGGKNLERNLVVNIYSGCTGPSEDDAKTLRFLSVPDDVVDNHIIFGVHCYSYEGNGDIDDIIRNIKARGVPTIVSEWGAPAEGVNCFDDIGGYFISQMRANEIPTFFWGGVSNGKNYRELPAINNVEETTIFLQYYYGNGYEPKLVTLDDYDYRYTDVSFDYLWAELSIYSRKFKLDEYVGIKIEVDDPSGVFLKIYGESDGKEQFCGISTTPETFMFERSDLGNKVTGITLQNTKDGKNNVRLRNTYLIRKDGTEKKVKPTSYDTYHGCSYMFVMPRIGDANNDVVVNAADIVEVLNYQKGMQSSVFNKLAADANGDGDVNEKDIEEIVKIIFKKIK